MNGNEQQLMRRITLHQHNDNLAILQQNRGSEERLWTSIDTEGEWGSIVLGYLASIIDFFLDQSKNSDCEGVGVGGMGHKSINVSDKCT